jgi:hypothetical protein
MTVRRKGGTSIVLEGECSAEDAEALVQMLQETPAAAIDWSACSRLHTAVIQVLLAVKARTVGDCGDPWVRKWAGSVFGIDA